MTYHIHGKEVAYDAGECGLYKSQNPILRPEYAVMDMSMLVNAINNMPIEQAFEAVTQLRDQAAQQARWQHTPQNGGFPILRQIPGPSTSIHDVRGNIQNTERFCTAVLNALKGE